MRSALNAAKRAIHLWGYALAEAIPMTRQKLLLTSPPTGAENNHHCNNSCRSKKQITCSDSTAGMRGSGGSGMCTLDPASTRLLLQACGSRQLSLDSVLLASLFLATAEAIRVEKQHAEATKHGGEQHAKGTRAHRALVLGVICVVMALLSGSIEAKLLRYFCCLYAVMTGVWAVNMVTVEKPGRAIIMATSSIIKVGVDTADETFTPVRLSVDCEGDVWDTAERLGRESRTLACSMSSFARFKIRVRRLRAWRLGQQRLAGDHVDTGITFYRPFQLFGCIRLEETASGGNGRQLTPEEALGLSCASGTRAMTHIGGGGESIEASDGTTTSALADSPLQAVLVLTALDSKYTLFYRETTTLGVSDRDEWVGTDEGAAAMMSDNASAREPVKGNTSPVDGMPDGSSGPRRLDLALVEGTRALHGKGSGWLLERAKAILLRAVHSRQDAKL